MFFEKDRFRQRCQQQHQQQRNKNVGSKIGNHLYTALNIKKIVTYDGKVVRVYNKLCYTHVKHIII